MVTEKIDRVVLAVKNLEKAKQFFEDLLNIKFDKVLVDEKNQMVKAIYSSIGLELVEPTSPNSAVAKFLEKRGEGLYAVVFKVSNLDSSTLKFKEKGIRSVGNLEIGLKEIIFHPKVSHGMMIILYEYEEWHPATIAAFFNH